MSCTCQSCGKKYTVDLIIPDKLWKQIKPFNKGAEGGLLCGSCIMDRIEEISGYDHWCLGKEMTDDNNIKFLSSLSKALEEQTDLIKKILKYR